MLKTAGKAALTVTPPSVTDALTLIEPTRHVDAIVRRLCAPLSTNEPQLSVTEKLIRGSSCIVRDAPSAKETVAVRSA